MKKILSIIIAAAICLGALTGCSGRTYTAQELYERSIAAVEEAGGFSVASSISVEASEIGEQYNENSLSMAEVNGGNWYFLFMSSIGGYWFEECVIDRMMYMTDGFDKVKTEIVVERPPVLGDYLPELAPEFLEGAEVQKVEDGFSFSIEPTDKILATAFEGMLAEFANGGVAKENSVMTFKFDFDGLIVSIGYDGDMTGDFLGSEATVHISADCVFTDVGTAPEVSAPEDAEEYELIEP